MSLRATLFVALAMLAGALDLQAGRIAYIYGDVAADGTIPSGNAEPYHPMRLNDAGPMGLSVFRDMVIAEGYEISEHYDQATTLNATFLNQYDAIVFGLHQKIWSAAEKAALEAWLRAGGGLLTYSDSASGGAYNIAGIKNPVGQNAVNNLTTAYGLQVTVDQGGGIRAYRATADATHPIVAGGLVLEGEGVSVIAVHPESGATVLYPFDNDHRVSGSNLTIDSQGVTIEKPQWAAMAVQSVGDGHIVVIFDRQPMWNRGPGSDITKRDNKEILRRTVRFLAGDMPSVSAPAFTRHPVRQRRYVGDTVTLSASVIGSPAPTLQWYRGETLLDGAVGKALTLESITLADAGDYTLVASNMEGQATSDAATLTVLPASARPSIPREGLVAEWLFDEEEGAIALDSSDNARHGTLVKALRVAGQQKGALSFNGTDASVQIPAFDVAGQALTISLWMRYDGDASRDSRLVSKATGTGPNQHFWKIGTHDHRRLRARLRVDGNTTEIISANDVFTLGQWHHVAMTYDGALFRVLVDGTPVASTALSGNLSTDAAVGVAIGNQPTGAGTRGFEGLIDQVRIYARALSTEELAALSK